MKIFLISITVVSSVLMIIVILLQRGKGAELGAAFGRGAQGGLVESGGKATFLSRTTSALAFVFLMSSLALSLFVTGEDDGVFQELEENAAQTAPADDSIVELLPDADSATEADAAAAPAQEEEENGAAKTDGNAENNAADVPDAPSN